MEKKLNHFVAAWIDFALAKRWLIIALTLLLTIISGFGLQNLSLNTSHKAFLTDEHRLKQMLTFIEDNYVSDNNVLFAIKPASGTVFDHQTLEAVRYLTEQSWQLPHAIRVNSLTNYQNIKVEGDELYLEPLLDTGDDIDAARIAHIEQVAMAEPSVKGYLVADDGKATLIEVLFRYDDQDIFENIAIEYAVQALVADVEARYPELELAHAGFVTAQAETFFMAMHDVSTLFSLAGIVVILGLYYFLRNLVATVACLAVIILSVVTTAGLMGFTHASFTLVTSSAPIIIMTLAVADSIHILMTVLRYKREGVEKNEAIRRAFQENFLAVFLTTLTTVIGFLTFNFSVFAPLQSLGNIVTVGIILAFLNSVLFLPALLSVCPLRVKPASNSKGLYALGQRLSGSLIRYRGYWIVGCLWVTLLCGLMLPKAVISDNYIEFYPEGSPYRVGNDFIEDNLGGGAAVLVTVETGEADGINDPDFVRRMDALAKWMDTLNGVTHVATFTETLASLNQKLHANDPDWYRLPDDPQAVAQYLLLYEMSLPYGLDLSTQVRMDKSGLRIIANVEDLDSERSMEMISALEAKLEELFPNEQRYYAGGILLVNYLIQDNLVEILQSSAVAFLIIGIILVITFRSLILGVVGMVGVLAPMVVFFGIWTLVKTNLGLPASMAIGMAIGIVVDNSVHMISKYIYAQRVLHKSNTDALVYSLTLVGPALFVNTAVLGLGFLILALADYAPNAYLGLMSGCTFILALFLNFFLVTPLLSYINTDTEKSDVA